MSTISRRQFLSAAMTTVFLGSANSFALAGDVQTSNAVSAATSNPTSPFSSATCKRRLNVINFIRGLEPRGPVDLFEPVKQQLFLARKYNLPTTWLLQYCAMVQGPFTEFLKKELNKGDELGFWFEMDQYLVEAAGLKWRSSIPWDYHVQHGFSIGYTQQERVKMIDTAFGKFRELFGQYPVSCGSWFFDAFSLQYMYEKYGILASCNCRDQFGTDGYSLWGGYADGGYYPSKRNAFIPAQTKENQVPVPVFRMLGSDPVDQFVHVGECRTMEPVWTGGQQKWVDWFLKQNYQTPCLSMAYAQIGQENSFGWRGMKNGLEYQYPVVAEMAKRGEISLETLRDTGVWFKNQYASTPAKGTYFPTASNDPERAAVWYFSARQRLGFYRDHDKFYLRDWRVFDENQEEPFLNSATRSNDCLYESLPIMDSSLWRPVDSVGLRFEREGQPVAVDISDVREQGVTALELDGQTSFGGLKIVCDENLLTIRFPSASFALRYPNCQANPTRRTVRADGIDFEYKGFRYALRILKGSFNDQSNCFLPDKTGELSVEIA